MKKIFLPLLLLAGIAVILNACKKEETDTETQSAVDNSICEGEFSRVMPTVNSIAIDEEGVHRLAWDENGNAVTSTCPAIIINPADTLDGFPVTLKLDYGSGCLDSTDNKTRKGVMEATFSAPFDQVGCVITINLVNYYVDNIQYEGTLTVTRNAQNSFTSSVANGKCTSPSWTLTWESTKTLTQSEGMSTITDPSDDVFIMTGSASGVNREGRAYSVNVTKQLTKRQTCAWIESGTIDLTPEGLATRTVDFGQLNQCDNQATLTINGNTFSFTLK